MKRSATIALFCLVACIVPQRTNAQVPGVQVFFNKSFTQPEGWPHGVGVTDTAYVVASNFDMFMSTIEFSITPPTQVAVWVGDVHRPGSLHLGESPTGVTVTYPIPLNAFQPVAVMGYAITYLQSRCSSICHVCPPPEYDVIQVQGHPYTGLIEAVEWNTYRLVQGEGRSSTICYPISTEPTTWGRVKALYH